MILQSTVTPECDLCKVIMKELQTLGRDHGIQVNKEYCYEYRKSKEYTMQIKVISVVYWHYQNAVFSYNRTFCLTESQKGFLCMHRFSYTFSAFLPL